jgi:Alpha/beta hydrolase domain
LGTAEPARTFNGGNGVGVFSFRSHSRMTEGSGVIEGAERSARTRGVQRVRAGALAGLALVAGTVVPIGVVNAAAAAHPAPSATNPLLDGPVTGGLGRPSLLLSNYPLADVGYAETEYYFSGNANSYSNVGPLGSDGKWTAEPATSAAYKSRLVVVQPIDASHFSGNVVIEWFNVSGGADGAPDWSLGHNQMVRNGDVYVGVSAQAVGVTALKATDAARYATLVHPGDSYSYDMFSQAGQAIRAQASTLLPGLRPKRFIAAGESQSAFRLTTYVNAIAPLVNVFDSYMINSRSGTGSALSQAPQAAIPVPSVVLIRDDSAFPVLTFQTETDVIGPLNYFPARQPDSSIFRLWEVAGTAHADAYLVKHFPDDNGSWASDLIQFSAMTAPPSSITIGTFSLSCPVAFNTGQQHYIFQSALSALTDWTKTGRPPRSMPRLDINTATSPPTYVKDSVGNVRGGIRNPAVDAPIAVLSGLPPAGAPGFCVLFGQTIPLTPTQISALYPKRNDFVQQWRRSVRDGLKNGYLLEEDAKALQAVVAGE